MKKLGTFVQMNRFVCVLNVINKIAPLTREPQVYVVIRYFLLKMSLDYKFLIIELKIFLVSVTFIVTSTSMTLRLRFQYARIFTTNSILTMDSHNGNYSTWKNKRPLQESLFLEWKMFQETETKITRYLRKFHHINKK